MTDADKNIPLFVAIEAGSLAICKELLAHFPEEQLKYTKVSSKTELRKYLT